MKVRAKNTFTAMIASRAAAEATQQAGNATHEGALMHPLASAGAVTASREIAAIAHAKVLFILLRQRADIQVVSEHR